MKTTVSLLLLLLPNILWGQIINHFGNPDSKWNVAKTYPAANQQNPTFVATTTTVYGFQGDTIINGEQWLKIYSANDSLFQSNLIYRGMISAENDKVFFIDTLNQRVTLYDFQLGVGDSVLFNLFGSFPEWLQVTVVDSIQIGGAFYKRLKFDEPALSAFDDLNEVWIEGIGSIHGPLFPHSPVKFSQEMPDSMLLICSFSENQQVWEHPSYVSCYVNVVLGINQPDNIETRIYPNPVTDILQIRLGNNSSNFTLIEVISVSGQVIRSYKTNDQSFAIDMTDLHPGLYFIRITDDTHRTRTFKTLRQ